MVTEVLLLSSLSLSAVLSLAFTAGVFCLSYP